MADGPFHREDENSPIADVNVVPLADVSLVLLIILLVLSPLAAQSMLRVSAAAARAVAVPPTHDELMTQREPEMVLAVGVSPLGFIVDGRLMTTAAEFTAWLKPRLAGRIDRKVFVAPELDVSHGRVVHVIETVTAAGGTVALVQAVDPQAR